MNSEKIIVFMTSDKEEVAKSIADRLLRDKKAACVSIFPRGNSFYLWKGELESAEEYLLIAKTQKALLGELIKVVKELHNYDVPEIVSVPITGGSDDYLKWLDEELS